MKIIKIIIKILITPLFFYASYLLGAKGFVVQNNSAADLCFLAAVLVMVLMGFMWKEV